MRVMLVLLLAGVAHADPVARFGMTFGVDRNAPEAHEVGPLIGLGATFGRFTGEANYTYLSFMDPDTSIHRVGIALRADFLRTCSTITCNGGNAVYAELGAAQRKGRWLVAEDTYATSQSEVYVSGGYQLAAGAGRWQIGLRLGIAPRDPMLDTACRGIGCPVAMPASSGIAESLMAEWMWLLR
jgi:hypothetical protein